MSDPFEASVSRLIACYAEARAATAALRRALDTDQTERLDELTGRREALVAEAARHMQSLARTGVSPSERGEVAAELSALIKEDQQLRAALASRALELPAQLSELRGAQAALGGYEAGAAGGRTDLSAEVDRRG